MTTKMGRYRFWGDQKPDTTRPLLTFSRAAEAVAATTRTAPVEQPSSTATLRIYGPIDSWGGWWGVSAKEVAQALDLLGDADRIVVRVNSPGGESSEGRAIVNLLRAHSAEIITVVDGGAYSAASYIAACGDDTVMSPGSTMMIHDTSTYLYGNAEAMRKAADVLDVLSNSGAELYAEIAGGTVEEWRDRQRAETWYSAASAVEAGLMKRVAIVPDAGPAETAGDDGPEAVDPSDVEDRARASYDLSLFEKAPKGLSPKPPTASAGGSTTTHGTETAVTFNAQQLTTMRDKLGLPETADEAAILAAVEAVVEESLEERPAPPTTTTVPDGMSLVSTEVLDTLRNQAQAGHEARQQQLTEHRGRVIDTAIREGRIAPAQREHFASLHQADPTGTEALIAQLTPGLVPVSELGHDQPPAESTTAAVDDSALDGFASQLGLTKEDLRG